jgi:hypothetical protein
MYDAGLTEWTQSVLTAKKLQIYELLMSNHNPGT